MLKLIAVICGGAIGAVLRYYGAQAVSHLWGLTFPFGTLFVNLIGSLSIGIMWGIVELGTLSPLLKIFLVTGMLGAFTTFSTFSIETVNLLRDNKIMLAVINIVVSNVLGILLAFIGYKSIKLLNQLYGTI